MKNRAKELRDGAFRKRRHNGVGSRSEARPVCALVFAAGLLTAARARAEETPPPPPVHDVPFRLVRTGITFGAALSAQIGNVLYTKTARQDTVQAVAMPYVEILPAYWVSPSLATRCSLVGSVDETTPRAASPASGSCLPYQLGAFIGRPANYDATTTILVDRVAQQRRTIHPDLTVGIAFTPSAFFSVLAGWSFASTTRDDGTEAFVGAITLGIGGNVDVVGGLL